MAVEWGSWDGPSGTRFRVGIDLSVSGTTITAKYYLGSEGGVSDDQRLVMGYSIVGSVNYTASQPFGGGTQLIATRSVTSSRGVQRRFSARIEGIYNGASPRVDAYAMVPAAAPSAPGTPSVSSVSSTSTRITWSAPSSTNGASIERYQVQRADNSSFTSGAVTAFTTSRSYTNSNLSPNRTYYWRVRAENSAGWSNWSGGRAATTSPALPTAPTSVGVTRNSDTSQGVSWTRQASSQAPYDSIQIERRDTVNGSWTRVATVGGSATSYTDTSTVASRRYDYRVRAVNSGGAGGYSATASVSTSPSAPSGVVAKKSGTQISVTWSKTTTQWGVFQHVIQDNPGGTGWVDVATVGDVTSWVHTSPDTNVTHQYRVASRVYTYGVGSAGLTGGWSAASAVVQLIAPPLAPSRRLPVGTIDRSAILTFAWTHNPVDTTEQAAYELQYRINGGAWTTLTGTTADYRSVSAPNVSGALEWQVRTKGEHPNFGPWSPVWSASLASLPAVVLLAPGAVLPSSRLTVEWSYANADGTGQAVWEAQLLDSEGALLETRTGSGGAVSAVFETALVDGAGYVARVRARSGAGMWSVWEEAAFTTNFPQPVTVEPIPVWDQETGTVSLTFTDPPEPALYAWTGTVDASTSTKTTDSGTLTNLATNPSFETPGSTVEVRRNLMSSPRVIGSVIDAAAGRTLREVLPEGGVRYTCLQTTGNAGFDSTDFPVVSGTQYVISLDISDLAAVNYCIVMNGYNSMPGQVYAIVDGRATITFTSNLTGNARLRTTLISEVGASFVVDRGMLEATTQVRPYFDWAYSPDPDLTPAAVGTPGASASILTATRAAYVTASGFGAHCYQSAQWSSSGTYSVCVDGSLMSGATGVAPEGIVARDPNEGLWPVINPGSTYTVAAWLRLAAPGVDVISRMRRFMLYTSTDGGSTYSMAGSDPAPNEPGIYLMRWTFTVPANADKWILRLGGNGSAAYGVEGDACRAWWDDLTIVEGEHPDLMPFHGGYQSTTAIDSITVQRRINDGDWVTLADNVQPDGAVTDPIPALAGTNTYRAVSKTTLPTSANGTPIDTTWEPPALGTPIYINGGENYTTPNHIHGDTAQETPNISVTFHHFAGENGLPTAYTSPETTRRLLFQGNILTEYGDTPREQWLKQYLANEPICYRDRRGRRLFGRLTGLSITDQNGVMTLNGEITCTKPPQGETQQ